MVAPLPSPVTQPTPLPAQPQTSSQSVPTPLAGTQAADWITGNQPGPYSLNLPGGYGGNAAVATWQLYHNNPAAASETTIQISPHFPAKNAQGLMADMIGYAAVDHFQLDTNHDGSVDGQELTQHFSTVAQQPQTAQKLSQQWLQSHDINQNNKIELNEHLATLMMETNAAGFIGYFEAAMADGGTKVNEALAKAFYHLVPFNTPDNRNRHHAAMFDQPDMLRTLLGHINEQFKLQDWLNIFGLK